MHLCCALECEKQVPDLPRFQAVALDDAAFRLGSSVEAALSSTDLQLHRYNPGTAGCSQRAKSKIGLAAVTTIALTGIRPIVRDTTMRYAMKQKVFCLGDDYRILDQDGRDVYLVDGKAFVLLHNRLVFLDMAGNELAEIRQRLLSWGPSYDILRAGEVAATLSKHLFTLAF